jgi:site-specific recombinase XerD
MDSSFVPVPRREILRAGFQNVPAAISRAGQHATWRFIEFFIANIRNRNTRATYAQAVGQFFVWCENRAVRELSQVRPVIISAYIEQLQLTRSAPTVKQHLAAVRMLFDWLVIGQIVEANPASSVRGPKYVVHRGKTPVLKADEARQLLDAIKIDTNRRSSRSGDDRSHVLYVRSRQCRCPYASRGLLSEWKEMVDSVA